MDWVSSFFARGGFLPHGVCFSWTPGLLWAMVTADVVIAASYFSIPLAIVSFVRKRGSDATSWVPWLFSAFIFACGITHVMDIWTIWEPDYGAQALTKGLTAGISLVTAVALWRLLPGALRVPSVRQLQAAVASLETEMGKRKSAEQYLHDVEQSLAVTLASIEAGFIATDAQGRVTRMNRVAEQLTGWGQDEARGQMIWQVFVRQDRPEAMTRRNPLDVIAEQGLTVDTIKHVVLTSRSGNRTEVDVQVALMRDDAGTPCGMNMVVRDMTRLNAAEVELRRLAAIVESSTDAIIGKTLDGRITSWNRAAEQMFGYTATEAIGQPVQMLIPPERMAEEMRILAQLSDGKTVPPFETERRAKDGRLLDLSITISPIHDAFGRVVGGSKIARDLSAQRRSEAALREKQGVADAARQKAAHLEAENRQIQEANRLKNQFLANMSHELRTPLNAVIGFADLLYTGTVPPESPKHHEFLGHIGTSGRHLLQLINDVLDLSKVEAGKFEFFPEPVDLGQLVREVMAVQLPAIQHKRLNVALDIAPDLTGLELDPARFKQVLYNYLSNAIKFTPEGGRVIIRARAEGAAHFRFEVEDSGIGIAPEDLPRLFVEFQQLDAGPTKKHQGTGLGLAITRRLVQAQGGSVGVVSTPGVGSVFHLVMLRVQPVASPGSAPSAHRLLVIETDPRAQARAVTVLADAGFKVDAVATGARAVAQARGQTYDALTLGLLLPDQRGLGALASIRSEGPNREAPVLAVTMATETDGAASFAIADVLGKPIRVDEVVAAMARFHPRQAGRPRVLVIDDEPMALDLMRATLLGMGIEALCRQDGRQALRELDQHQPDAIILDLMMPEFDGFAVLDELRHMPAWQHLPVFIWTSMILSDEEYASLARSARAVLGKGGGALEQVLQTLSHWRPRVAPTQENSTQGSQP